jgi:galactose mutarotase-like enzyme
MHLGGDNSHQEDVAVWPHTEFTMFPIIGKAENDSISIGGNLYPITRQGMPRNIEYDLIDKTRDSAGYVFDYTANTPVPNAAGGIPPCIHLPYDFCLGKTYTIDGEGLNVDFTVSNTGEQPFDMKFGWHPGFKVKTDKLDVENIEIMTFDGRKKYVSLRAIENCEGNVMHEEGWSVSFPSKYRTVVVESYMGKFNLWKKPNSSLLSVQPTTHFPVRSGDPLSEGAYTLEPKDMLQYKVRVRV